jgi:hypothetical protein
MSGVERPGTRGQNSVSSALSGHRGLLVRPPDPIVAAVFADFARAVEAGDSHAIRLVDPLAPETPRRRNLAPRLERGGAD